LSDRDTTKNGGWRRGVVDVLQRIRERVDPASTGREAQDLSLSEGTLADPRLSAASHPEPVVLEPEDVELDAFHVLDKRGIGYDFAFVDVRQIEELRMTGIIEGAVHIPLDTLAQRLDEVPRGQRVVVYCAAGARSLRGAMMLRAGGHDDAWSLAGGVRGWRADGGDLVPLASDDS
jgi:rhodanese-related sulfurtransferase